MPKERRRYKAARLKSGEAFTNASNRLYCLYKIALIRDKEVIFDLITGATFMEAEASALRAGEFFDNGYFCAESVLLAVAERLGIKADLIPRIATGLCSGISRTRGICGAVSGAILAIGIANGRDTPSQSVNDTYKRVQGFLASFKESFGSTNCLELIGSDLSTNEGRKAFQDENMRTRCKQYTEDAVRLALKFISE